MEIPKEFEESIIFPAGERMENEAFIGAAWLHALVPPDNIFNCPIFNVTFEPGTRNNWHTHPGGQILLITAGKGYYQEDGKEVQLLKEGDVVKILPDVKHWHGATADSWFAHLAINTNVHLGMIEWMEPVTDEHYSKLP